MCSRASSHQRTVVGRSSFGFSFKNYAIGTRILRESSVTGFHVLRAAQVDQVKAAIEAIPDGVHGTGRGSPVKRAGAGADQLAAGKGADGFIHIEAHGRGENYFTATAESSKFRQVHGAAFTSRLLPFPLGVLLAGLSGALKP